MSSGHWQGTLTLGDSWAIWDGAVGDGECHRHFAAQAVIAPEPVRVINGNGMVVCARCVLIEPLAPHRLDPAPWARLIYLEPAGRANGLLQDLLLPVWQDQPPPIIGAEPGRSFWTSWRAASEWVEQPLDIRIKAVMHHIDATLSQGVVPLEESARIAGLSPDRFRHLFAEEMGLAYRRYVLWRRLRLAAAELLAGRGATTAAHAAGFADAAHFARTLKSTFGVTAGQSLLMR
jgi:AraC-like DNA-binding protein